MRRKALDSEKTYLVNIGCSLILMWDLFKVAFTVQCILISLNFV